MYGLTEVVSGTTTGVASGTTSFNSGDVFTLVAQGSLISGVSKQRAAGVPVDSRVASI